MMKKYFKLKEIERFYDQSELSSNYLECLDDVSKMKSNPLYVIDLISALNTSFLRNKTIKLLSRYIVLVDFDKQWRLLSGAVEDQDILVSLKNIGYSLENKKKLEMAIADMPENEKEIVSSVWNNITPLPHWWWQKNYNYYSGELKTSPRENIDFSVILGESPEAIQDVFIKKISSVLRYFHELCDTQDLTGGNLGAYYLQKFKGEIYAFVRKFIPQGMDSEQVISLKDEMEKINQRKFDYEGSYHYHSFAFGKLAGELNKYYSG